MPTKDKEIRRLQNKRFRDNHPETKNIRNRNETPERKRRWNIKTRYGLTDEDVLKILEQQENKCAICGNQLIKYHIDHNHITGELRGLLCHRCNIRIGGWDDPDFSKRALKYLGIKP